MWHPCQHNPVSSSAVSVMCNPSLHMHTDLQIMAEPKVLMVMMAIHIPLATFCLLLVRMCTVLMLTHALFGLNLANARAPAAKRKRMHTVQLYTASKQRCCTDHCNSVSSVDLVLSFVPFG